MNRRSFLGGCAGAGVLAVAASPFLVPAASPAAPGSPGVPGLPDEAATAASLHAHRDADGTWTTHLLPFAAAFATLDAVGRAVADAKRLGLLR